MKKKKKSQAQLGVVVLLVIFAILWYISQQKVLFEVKFEKTDIVNGDSFRVFYNIKNNLNEPITQVQLVIPNVHEPINIPDLNSKQSYDGVVTIIANNWRVWIGNVPVELYYYSQNKRWLITQNIQVNVYART